ncbi:MAG: DoxX family protein [Anaerolineae bacterium]
MSEHIVKTSSGRIIEDPPLARLLFSDTRFAVVWLVIRVLIGYSWLSAGWGKVTNPAWMQTGEALKGYWTSAVAIPEAGRPAITFDWYRSFLQGMLDSGSYVWFAKLVAVGELLVGVALIIGAFVGVAAFFGAFMNWNYLMAGSASTNPLLLIGAVVLILAWKTAGYYGLDYFLLPRLGTPWSRREEVGQTSTPPVRRSPGHEGT